MAEMGVGCGKYEKVEGCILQDFGGDIRQKGKTSRALAQMGK